MLIDLANTISEFKQLKSNADAAIDFIKNGPYSFEELQVPSPGGYKEFSNYYEFRKDAFPGWLLVKRFGPAGDGKQYHHLVTQGGANEGNIPSERLHNTDNIIRLPALLHEAVNAEYLGNSPDENLNMYQWRQTQPYEVQREEGLKILRRLHILK